jgi:dihydropteroate synthase
MHILNCNGKIVNLSRPFIMAIVNLSPDSFYNQSTASKGNELLEKAEDQIAHGADILDLGLCSTRPNSKAVGQNAEMERLGKSVIEIKKRFPDILISIDSYLPTTVKEGLQQGADFINDVSGNGATNGLGDLAKTFSVPYILMDNPSPMHSPQHTNSISSVQEVVKRLNIGRDELLKLGVKDIIIDPGFGFGKTTKENFDILNSLEVITHLHAPIMVGLSRKRMVCEAIDKSADEAGMASSYLNAIAAKKGAQIIRTHDGGMCQDLLKINSYL